MNIYTDSNLFILQEVYSTFIKEVTCPSKISFYRNHKENSDYIERKYYRNVSEDIDKKFIHRGVVVFLTEEGLKKFMSQNKKKISNKCPNIFAGIEDFDFDLIKYDFVSQCIEPSFLALGDNSNTSEESSHQESCSICLNNLEKLYTVQEFQQKYYNDMISLNKFKDESYKNANCLIKCQTCVSTTCLFCLVKQTTADKSHKRQCCVCKQPNDIQTNDSEVNVKIKIMESVKLHMAVLQITIMDTKSLFMIQFDGIIGYRLIFQSKMYTNILYYDPDMTIPQISQYLLHKSNLASSETSIFHYFNGQVNYIRSLENDAMFQMLGVNRFRTADYNLAYTYECNNLMMLERYSDSGRKQSQLQIPIPDQFEHLLSTHPQSKLSPKSLPKRFNGIRNCMGDSQFTCNKRLMIFINKSACYCGGSIPIKAYYIYNQDEKEFKIKDIVYNLKKQGLRSLCNHSFLESIYHMGSNVFSLSFGS